VLRLLRNLLILVALTAASVGGLAFAWSQIGGAALTVHGWIALTLGIFGTIALAWGLMALAFRSSREGWDDRVGDTDPRDKP
jgi:hypothetical protein